MFTFWTYKGTLTSCFSKWEVLHCPFSVMYIYEMKACTIYMALQCSLFKDINGTLMLHFPEWKGPQVPIFHNKEELNESLYDILGSVMFPF